MDNTKKEKYDNILLELLVWYQGKSEMYRNETLLVDVVNDFKKKQSSLPNREVKPIEMTEEQKEKFVKLISDKPCKWLENNREVKGETAEEKTIDELLLSKGVTSLTGKNHDGVIAVVSELQSQLSEAKKEIEELKQQVEYWANKPD